MAVSLAEKIDKLTGFWAIDEKPTGSKDPFALRRAALGLIRILVENDLRISVLVAMIGSAVSHSVSLALKSEDYWELAEKIPSSQASDIQDALDAARKAAIQHAVKSMEFQRDQEILSNQASSILSSILAFLHDRLKVYLRDQGVRHDIIDACIAMPQNDDLTLLVKRARALSETLKTDDGENLIQGFRRANNILTQAEEADGVEYSYGADVKFSETEEEKALFEALDEAEAVITPAMEQQDFTSAMSAMASLRTPIDAFFDAVQVNSDNATVRRNRLNLLSRIRTICTSVADLTRVDG